MAEMQTTADEHRSKSFCCLFLKKNKCLAWDKKSNSANTENRHGNKFFDMKLTCVNQIFFYFEL